MTRPAHLLLAVLLLGTAACSVFLPREKSPHQVCGPVTPIRDDADSTHVLAYARLCYTAWSAPGALEPDSVSDSVRTVSPVRP